MHRDLKGRTKAFALGVLRFERGLSPGPFNDWIAIQLVRAGTSVSANYRAACRAKSRADVVAKLTTTEEESDQTSRWLEVIVEEGVVTPDRACPLLQDADELTAIMVASARTASVIRT